MVSKAVYSQLLLFILCTTVFAQTPPFTDYCDFLTQEIQGKKHGFMAGNNSYYVGGYTPVWNAQEDETVGLTHPFFSDLRSRGTGKVSFVNSDGRDAGYGNDFQGWEFYKDVRAAYGTVITDDSTYVHPVPTSMQWRPDKMICEYVLPDVTIREEKFIAANDVVSTIITASKPVRILFEGRSFYIENAGGKSITSTAEGRYDTTANAIHITQGGTVTVRPIDGWANPGDETTIIGDLMYDGMSQVISTSVPLENVTFSITKEKTGHDGDSVDNVVHYSFEVPVDDNGMTLSWSMHDSYDTALVAIQEVLADPAAAMTAKTDTMNSQLNYQIPYFRCSDDDIVQVYYFLNAINLMYYTFKDKGQLKYPHTQTAVNNYLGIHAFDNVFQSRVGSWYTDKERYAYGNILVWSSLLKEYNGVKDYVSENRDLPDNFGIDWNSTVFGGPSGIAHIPQAWQIFEHSGDTAFLADAYLFYSRLYPEKFYGMHWGFGYNAGPALQKMAQILGKPTEEADKWVGQGYSNNEWVESEGGFLDNNWEKEANNLFGGFGTREGQKFYGWNTFAYGNMDQFRRDDLQAMTTEWLIDSVKGFNHPECNPTFGPIEQYDLWPDHFASAPDIAWYAYKPLFKHHLCGEGIYLTLKHLKQYNMEWGIPVAPEARKKTPFPALWGDQYSNFNAGKIDLLIEGIGGINYSFVDSSFTFANHLPKEWSFMEWRVPVKHHSWSEPKWVLARSERSMQDGALTKTSRVSNNPMANLRISPWNEEDSLAEFTPEAHIDSTGNHGEITFSDSSSASVTVKLSATEGEIVAIKRPQSEIPLEAPLFSPNPVSSGDSLIFQAPDHLRGEWSFTIYDHAGNLITTKQLNANANKISWNLKNRQGRLVSPGFYLAIVSLQMPDGAMVTFKRMVGVRL